MGKLRMKKFPVSVDPDLHKRFKTLCVQRDITMADAVRALLTKECAAAVKAKASPMAQRAGRLAEATA